MKRIVLATLSAAVILAPEVAHAETFADAGGDGMGHADITLLEVTQPAFSGGFEVAVTTSDTAPDTRVVLVFDTDRDRLTGATHGGWGGAERYCIRALDATGGSASRRWSGSEWVAEPPRTCGTDVAVSGDETRTSFMTDIRGIGGARSGSIFAFIDRPPGRDAGDRAPDTGAWSYELGPYFSGFFIPAIITRPRAGTILDARSIRLRLDTGALIAPPVTSGGSGLRCELRLASGRLVRPLVRWGCRWQLTRAMRGRTLQLWVAVFFGSSNLTNQWNREKDQILRVR